MTTTVQRLRSVWLVLLGLVWITMGQPTASAEHSDFGGCAFAAKTTGSGPARGFIEVSESYSSVNAVKNFQGKGTDFIFDTQTGRFVMGNNPSGHTGIAQVMGVAEAQQGRLVGGTIYRQNGVLMTNEHSGHFGHLWNDANRAQFQQFMNNSGVGSTHSATWGR